MYIDALNLTPRIQNQIRCMATFDNPVFYKNKRLGYSNYYNFSTIYMGEDNEGYIKIPRGLLEDFVNECKSVGIEYDIEDNREKGRPIRVSFNGELRVQQDLAANRLLSYDNGILSATTAFGKTVVCSYLVAQRKVNTLILVENVELVSQWKEELEKFLVIDEKLPEYRPKTGRIKKRNSLIGILKGGKDTLAGIVDVAMIGSLYKKGSFHEKINFYGMVIMDECHHAASSTAQEILKKVNASYVYGVSATPMRSDNLEKINYMLIGPIRHRYTALERAISQGIDRFVIPRYTRSAAMFLDKDINKAYNHISTDDIRNLQILDDIRVCVERGRTPVVLTRFKEQAKYLYEKSKEYANNVFLMYGDNTNKENEMIRNKMKSIPNGETLILFATGSKIGEGFDFPRLDTLMLAAPVSYEGRLEQYIGRLNRDYAGKKAIYVYDYIDSHIKVFDSMYLKRLRAYKKMGFRLVGDPITDKQDVNAIYDAENYMEVFERDLIEAEKDIIISSPKLCKNKIERFVHVVKSRQEAGVAVTVFTEEPENDLYGNGLFTSTLIDEMKKLGINVIVLEEVEQHYAIIDNSIVWHGGMNLLGKEDVWDNLIRIKDSKVANELLIIAQENMKDN